jgi:peptide/nickel transport system ATP-binding protein
MTDPVLEAENLRVQFGQTVAVDGVSLRVGRGRIVGLVGESGSGKSVTARTLMRMVPEPGRITGGTVRFGGRDLLALPEGEMRSIRGERIAMVFQDPQASLNPVVTVGAQVAEALIVHGMSRRKARRRAVELLELVGIPDTERRAGEYPHQFSGGMRQRVMIAMALAGDPALLVADEPTTALDVTIQAQILKLLAELRDRIGVAVLLITHDMGVVAELCDELAVMYGGRIVETGTVAGVFAAPAHPYTRDLLRAMPRLGDVRRLYAIPGKPPDPARLPTGCAFHPRCALAEDRCRTEKPVLTAFADGREVACWFPVRADGVVLDSTPGVERAVPSGSPILEIENLRINVGKRRAPVYAVDGVALRVHAGETLGLVGESGCGKSTLARAVVGINEPVSGVVRVRGKDVASMSRRETAAARRKVQYVFQDPYASLNPRRTVRQVLDEALEVAGVEPAQRRARSVELLELVGLGERHLDRYPHAFSGGQRQRIGIARSLAVEPDCLVLDEPVSALDVSIQAQVMNLLTDLRDRLGLGYLFIAHDLAVVRSISDRVAVMYLGKIVESGPAEELYRDPLHPYTVSLLSSSPSMERQRERIVLTGDLPSPKNPPSGCRFRTRCPIGPLTHPERTICAEKAPELPPGVHGAACHFAGEMRQELLTDGKTAV